jgi:hypothetical protein
VDLFLGEEEAYFDLNFTLGHFFASINYMEGRVSA